MDTSAMWSKDPLSKPSPSDGAPTAVPGLVGNCISKKGISMAVVDANAVIEGGQSLTNLADKLVTVPQVLTEIRDSDSRRRLDFIAIEPMEPSPESLSKVDKFARYTGDFPALSDVDRKLIALTYTLEALVHGTKNIRDVPPPIQTFRVSESSIACFTGDYAMQNVILQMGLRLIAPKGMQIRQLNRWTWKCHACCKKTLDFGTGLCPMCGNGGALRKVHHVVAEVALTIDENGTVVAARTPRITL